MGVYIKDVNKPKECTRCKFTYNYEHPEAGDYEVCQFINEPIPQAGIDNRCPLVEVKEPHGRLIDANALLNISGVTINITGKDNAMIVTQALASIYQDIKDAPTIIDAESEE